MADYKEITSLTNPYVKDLVKLKEKKYRSLLNEYIIEGKHLVDDAYEVGLLKEVISTDDSVLNNYQSVSKIKVNEQILNKIADTQNPQNVLGICEIKNIDVDYKNYKHLLILDDVKDPGNVGTLIRTALAFDIDLVLLSNESCDVYNSKVVRSTQGAIFKIDIAYKDLSDEIKKIKKEEITVISTSLNTSTSIKDIKKIDKYAIILGNEANGVTKDIQKEADINVIIPISKDIESLNVAIAGAIMMYEVRK